MKQTLLFTLFAAFSFSVANAQVPSYVPTDGLVGWWPFNGDAADESGNGNDGTVNGATLTTDRNGVENAAYSFDGVNDWIEIPNNNSFSFLLNSDFSINIWLKKNSELGTFSLIGQGDGDGQHENKFWRILLINELLHNHIRGDLSDPFDTKNIANTSNYENWIMITSIRDFNNHLKLYINSTLIDIESDITGLGSPFFEPRNIYIAAFYNAVIDELMQHLNGSLDDIGIWNRALTEEEIQLLYNGCTVTPTAIVGENAPLNFTTSTYFCNDNPGSSYTWTVTNGVISSGQGTNSIVVLWGNEGEGTVSVIETNAEGCDGPVASFVVDVQCSSNITSIDGNINPVILSPIAYTVNGPADSEYTWSVSNGVIVSGQGTNSVNVIWAAEGEGTLSVIETTSTGCASPVVTITTNATVTSVIEQEDKRISIYPNPASDRMTLQCGAENIGEEYIIYDALGKIVMRGKIINTVTTININELRSGEYFIKIGEEVIKAVKE